MDVGDIYLADLHEERRRHVLVMSNGRFNRTTSRAIVAPEVFGPPDEVPYPWRIEINGMVFAIDLLRSLPSPRLLDHTGRADQSTVLQLQRVIRHIL